MSWHRVDDSASLNPKFSRLTDAEHRALTAGLWLYCARQRNGGHFTLEELPAMAYVTPKGPRAVTVQDVRSFIRYGLVDNENGDGNSFQVHDWETYNPKDATGADRMRRMRERREQAETTPDPPSQERNSVTDEPVTPLQANRHPARAVSRPIEELREEPVPVPTSTTDVRATSNGERAQADDLDFEELDYRAALASLVDVGDGAEDEPA